MHKGADKRLGRGLVDPDGSFGFDCRMALRICSMCGCVEISFAQRRRKAFQMIFTQDRRAFCLLPYILLLNAIMLKIGDNAMPFLTMAFFQLHS